MRGPKPAIKLQILKRDSAENLVSLQEILEAAPSYWKRITARLPERNAARVTFDALPDGKSYGDKFVMAVLNSGVLIGCVDLIRGYPNSETAMLGLLLISESEQGKGHGKSAYQAIEDLARSWPGTRKIRIGVIAANEVVLPFWKSQGFVDTGIRRPYEENGVLSETLVLEKSLAP